MEEAKAFLKEDVLSHLEMLEARSRSLALQQQEGLLQQERLAELRETVEVLQVRRDQLRAKIATGRVARQLEEESDTDDEDEESLSPDEETLMAIMNARVINLQNMLQVHRLAGFDIKVACPGRAVCFTVYTAFEGIYLDTFCLDVDIKQIQISRHNIPPHIPVAELAEQYLRQDIPTFLSMLSRHLNAYVGRKYQIDQIKEHFGGSVLIENTLCGVLILEYSTCCKGVEHKFIVALEYRDVTRCMPTKVTVTFTGEGSITVEKRQAQHCSLFQQTPAHTVLQMLKKKGHIIGKYTEQ